MNPPPKFLKRISEFQYQRYKRRSFVAGSDLHSKFRNQLSTPQFTATVFNVRQYGMTPPGNSSRSSSPQSDPRLECPLICMLAPPSDYDNDQACLVCWVAPPDAVLLECGHGGLCVACAERLWQGGRRCPLCRASFAGVVRIVDADAAVVRRACCPDTRRSPAHWWLQ
jgi:hypothetical protein